MLVQNRLQITFEALTKSFGKKSKNKPNFAQKTSEMECNFFFDFFSPKPNSTLKIWSNYENPSTLTGSFFAVFRKTTKSVKILSFFENFKEGVQRIFIRSRIAFYDSFTLYVYTGTIKDFKKSLLNWVLAFKQRLFSKKFEKNLNFEQKPPRWSAKIIFFRIFWIFFENLIQYWRLEANTTIQEFLLL